jgi:hypothetical protein
MTIKANWMLESFVGLISPAKVGTDGGGVTFAWTFFGQLCLPPDDQPLQ